MTHINRAMAYAQLNQFTDARTELQYGRKAIAQWLPDEINTIPELGGYMPPGSGTTG